MKVKSLVVQSLIKRAHKGSRKEQPQILLHDAPPAVRALKEFALGVELAQGKSDLIRRAIKQNWIRFSQIHHMNKKRLV